MDRLKKTASYFIISLLLAAWLIIWPSPRQFVASLQAAQDFTSDVYSTSTVAQTCFENMEKNFLALQSNFSGGSSPASPVALQFWADTTANILKIRNEANSAWLNLYDFANQRVPLALLATNCSRTVTGGTGISVSGNLNSGNVTVSVNNVPLSRLAAYTAGEYAEIITTNEIYDGGRLSAAE
ncbi:MAG: hypothetical protein ACP5FL_08995, partial [Thermoplasmatota archaeon]